ncbi:hypothetical protein [Streptomyces sp. NPDC001153]
MTVTAVGGELLLVSGCGKEKSKTGDAEQVATDGISVSATPSTSASPSASRR